MSSENQSQPADELGEGLRGLEQERTWLRGHLEALRARLAAVGGLVARPGRGGAKRREAAQLEADKLERRYTRLLRGLNQLEARADARSKEIARAKEQERERAKRLARSKDPRHRAEVILRALDDLPAELAAQITAEGAARAAARLGRAQEGSDL